MKKIIGVLFLVLFCVIGTNAQDKGFTWGVKAGLNLSSAWGEEAEGSLIKPGYYAGCFGEYRFNDLFAVSPELMFSSIGSRREELDINETVNYITLPVLAKFYLGDSFSVEAGPQFGYGVYMSIKGDGKVEKLTCDDYNQFEFGIAVGASYYYERLSVSLRYIHGLTDVVKEGINKNYNFQIGLGLKI